MKDYLAEVAETVAALVCALTNHWGGCRVLRYSTRRWNPVAALYHWGTDVAMESGRTVARCGCTMPEERIPYFRIVGDTVPDHGGTVTIQFDGDGGFTRLTTWTE